MSEYLIWNSSERKFVAREGSEKSFTSRREHARRYNSFIIAEANCCGNEHPVHISGLTNSGSLGGAEQ